MGDAVGITLEFSPLVPVLYHHIVILKAVSSIICLNPAVVDLSLWPLHIVEIRVLTPLLVGHLFRHLLIVFRVWL